MLKITSHRTSNAARLMLEGRLTGPWVHELERVWLTVKPADPLSLVVDLTSVTFIGEDGKALLNRMWREGATFVANGCCTGHIVEEITGSQSGESVRRGRT